MKDNRSWYYTACSQSKSDFNYQGFFIVVVTTTTPHFKGEIESLLFNPEFEKQDDCTFFCVCVFEIQIALIKITAMVEQAFLIHLI